ncbi:CPBP family intramembrane glutamic endopeptidase [Thiocystis violascens]|uniref:CAAX amino terminal protease family n=1 Tax=Thiocystis violascens (strain ATCC 17096 / DSM 198 / 6111) TaxID=765911 RepID=I3YB05_THIV6|nr:CPBP family intramembrane glutamic endopeptidase [Thiocystis violascens]AFL74173.1 CAAX amino terminal protease family [Thiocystis violascens DSM 198]
MRATLQFFLYLLVCLILAALLAPALLATGWIDLEPQRAMGRLAQIFMLLGIWPLLRWLSLADRGALGYAVSGRVWRRSVGLGWLQGVAILLALVLVLLALDIRIPDPNPWPGIAGKAAQALIGGLLIGFLEETFFRGALYSAIRRRDGMRSAIVWSALLYALVHFMKPGALPAGMVFDWTGALWMFAHVFGDLFQWNNLDSMVALFCVGVFLALVRERTGQIGWCIGLHAGWVFVIQMTRRVTDGNDASNVAFLVGEYDGTIGWLAALWIGLLAFGFWTLTRRSF